MPRGSKCTVPDLEYNRANGDTIKTIVGQRMEPVSITCDLILHSRRGQMPEQDNYLRSK